MNKKILIVDDLEQNRYLLRAVLAAAGYTTEEAANGVEALEMARREAPDLIISDVLMPQMDGFALCRQCKEDARLAPIPFVFYTATYTDPRERELGLSLGAARFVVKPVEGEEFTALVRAVLDEYATGKLDTAAPAPEDETAIYRLYNEALVRKLEEKMLALEESNRALTAEADRRRVSERRRSLQHSVTHALSGANSLADAMPRILQAVCAGLGWERGECWSAHWDVHKDAVRLRCIATAQTAPDTFAGFDAATRGLEFAPGEGLIGRAWQSGKPEWTPDVLADGFARIAPAVQAGARAALACPVRVGEEVLGVMAFLDGAVRPPDEEQLRLLEDIGHQIGQFIERGRAEARLAARERRFRALIEKSGDAVILFDAEGTFLYRSPSAQAIFGYSDDETLGRNFIEFIHPEDLPQVGELFAGFLAAPGKSFEAQFRYRHRDGDWRYVEATATNWLADPDVAAVVANVRDVTARVRAEEQVNFQARLLGLVGNAVIATDLQGRVIYWNPAAEELYGWSAAEALGQSILELTPAQQSREEAEKMMAQLLQGHSWSGEFLVRHKDGSPFPAFVFDTPIVDARGNLAGVIGVSNDISQRNLAEERIRRQFDELQTVHRISQRFARLQSLPEFAEESIAILEEELDYNFCAILLLDETGETLYPFVVGDQKQGRVFTEADKALIASHGFRLGEGIVGWVAQHGQIVRTGDAQNDPRYYALRSNIQSELCVPLWLGDRVIGVVNVEDTRPNVFSEADERVLETVASQIAVAIQNAQLWQQIRQELAARQEAEEHYRLLVENVPAVVYKDATDKAASSYYINPQVEALLGYPPAAYGEDPTLWHRQIDPRDYDVAVGSIQKTLAQGKAEVEYRLIAQDGRVVWVRDSSVLVRDADGAPQSILGFIEDISARKQRERELEAIAAVRGVLRKATTRAEMLAVALDELMAVLGVEGASLEILEADGGLRIELARGAWASLSGERAAPGAGLSGRILSTGQPYFNNQAQDDPALFRPGAFGDCQAAAGVPLVARGETIGLLWIGSQRSLTEHDLRVLQSIADIAANALQRQTLYEYTQWQAEQIGQIMRSVPDGVLLLDDEQRLLQANPAGLEVLALLGEFAAAGGSGALRQAQDSAGGAGEGERLIRLDDRPLAHLLTSPPGGGWHEVRKAGRIFEALAQPLAPGPTARGWVLVVREVTRQREAQEQLQRQERLAAVGQLAAGIAHDFNNVMGAILLHAQLLDYSRNLTPKERERLAVIQQQSRHAAAMIGQILDFSRRSVLERQPVDLLPLFKEQVKLLQRTLPEHIRIDLTGESGEYVVLADPTRMQQIMMNLAINARDAMPEGGDLTVDLAHLRIERASELPLPAMAVGDWVRVSVSDTGSGIAPEALPHIFEPFFTTKEPGSGTGLGLAQVYGIVGQHGGQITAHSQVGQGTVFTIYLPGLAEEAETLPETESELLLGKGELLLLVEDNEQLRAALAEYLQSCHYRVVVAGDGEEALALLAAGGEQPGLVLSDLVMPRMGGKALLSALRGQGYGMPVIFISGHPLDEGELKPLTGQGVGGWLRKPLRLGEVARTIARCLMGK